MALHLGELVAGLRADDAPFTRALTRAELAMRGLTRGVDGRLRDIHGRFVRDSDAMGRSLSNGIGRGARSAVLALKKIAPAVAGVGVGLPAVAAVATALGGLAAGAVAAGLAVKAFQLAAKPQLDAVAESTAAAEKAEKAHEVATRKKAAAQELAAKGGDKYKAALREAESATKAAKDADAAYEQQLKGLPPATREYAKSLSGLKKDHQEWSDELSKDTMPVFTKGIEIARDLLPTLTPFVRAAATAIGGFLDEVSVGVKSAGFKEWAADMAAAAGPALSNFLQVIKNLAIGFGGLMQAFLPVSDGMTGGLVSMTKAFADWGTSLKGSEGFAQFMELAREGGTTLGQLAMAVGNLLVALSPLIGVTTQVTLALARIINALPPEVLSVLATTIATVVIGMKAWAVGARVVAVANRVMAASSMAAVTGWLRMMAVGVGAYVRIAAAAVASAARTAAAWAGAVLRSMAAFAVQMIRAAAVAVAQFAIMAARAIAWAAVMAAQWLIAMGPIGWITIAIIALVALVIAKWETVKTWTVAAWTAVRMAVTVAVQGIMAAVAWLAQLPGMVAGWFSAAREAAVSRMVALVSWLAGLPGRVGAALSGLAGVLRSAAVRGFTALRTAAASQASAFLGWVRGLPGRISSAIGSLSGLLVSKGRDVVRGLWNGIKSMGGWLKSTLIGWAKSIVPGPIAKALHIGSPSKLMADEVGRWIPAGIAQGAQAGSGVLDKTMANLVSTPTPSAAMAMGTGAVAGGSASAGASGAVSVVRLESDGSELDEWFLGRLRKIVKDRGGNVQFVVGR